jgi:hypothetical protein
MGVEGGLKILLCVVVGRCNDGRVGVSLSKEAQIMNNGASNAKAALAVKSCRIPERSSLLCYPRRNPSWVQCFDRKANFMRLPYFCLCRLLRTSVTNVTESPCCTHGRMLLLGADAMSDP